MIVYRGLRWVRPVSILVGSLGVALLALAWPQPQVLAAVGSLLCVPTLHWYRARRAYDSVREYASLPVSNALSDQLETYFKNLDGSTNKITTTVDEQGSVKSDENR